MSDLPNIVYFGSDAICLPGLDYLKHESAGQWNLRAIISQPDRRRGRGKQLQPNPVSAWALNSGVELLRPEKPSRELANWIQEQNIQVGLVMAYGHFLPKFMREAPRHGLLNFHGSLLPKYRGASPIETAIAMGETETGVSLMQIVREMDAGGVADMETLPVDKTIIASELRALAGEAVVALLHRNLSSILDGKLTFESQDEEQATFCRKLCKEDGLVDFTLPAIEIYNRFRAFLPWPGCCFVHGEKRIKVGRATVDPESMVSVNPGTVLAAKSSLQVATGKGLISFQELQLPGARMLPAADFLRGYSIGAGEQLTGGKAEALVYTKN